jgi:MFS transporter, ACS family, glucarate transporter
MWILSAMYFCYAYNVSVYLSWFPKYLNAHRGFSIVRMGIYASLPLLAGMFGDIAGGWLSDRWASRSGNLTLARRGVGAAGFLLAAVSILLACLTPDPLASIRYHCLAMFGLELTVGVSWAIPLDIGRDYAGSVSAIMNTCGNLGGAIASAASAYLVMLSGWNAPFLVVVGLSVIAAIFYLRIDAAKQLPVS